MSDSGQKTPGAPRKANMEPERRLFVFFLLLLLLLFRRSYVCLWKVLLRHSCLEEHTSDKDVPCHPLLQELPECCCLVYIHMAFRGTTFV